MAGLELPSCRAKLEYGCVAAREGLEPPTLALGKLCSIRLSYRATLVKSKARFRAPDRTAGEKRQAVNDCSTRFMRAFV